MDITLLIRLAVSFLTTAIKNPDSKKARRILKYVKQLRDAADQYIEVLRGVIIFT